MSIWDFWKKEPPKEGRIIYVPDEHAREILELADKFNAAPQGQDNVAKYIFWKRIEELIPETRKGGWKFRVIRGTKVGVREILS